MSDIFREVDEEIRQDQVKALWRRFGPLVVTAALVAVVGTAGYVGWQRWQARQATERTAVLLDAVAKAEQAVAAPEADPIQAVAPLVDAAAGMSGDQATLARLRAAAILAAAEKTPEAVALYDTIAAGPEVEPLLRDLAVLLATLHQLDSGDPAQLAQRLAPLTQPGNPWRWSASELAGLLAARQGDTARAHTLFQDLAGDAEAPAGLRARAADLAALYAPSAPEAPSVTDTPPQ